MRPLIAIDRGGTFTDGILRDPATGEERVTKVLSGPDSPLLAIRRLLELKATDAIPPCEIRLGTTMATNALLERKGRPTGLLITRGFKDLLRIGTQARPRLFELDIRRPPPLHQAVCELDARVSARGQILARPTREEAEAAFSELRAAGVTSLCIAVLHATKNPELELELEDWARAHFDSVVPSHRASGEEGFLARTSTAVLEAFLGPALCAHLEALERQLPGSQLLVMQSTGGLSSAQALRGPAALLSGPAGGVVAGTRIAAQLGVERLVTLDMGGTSTDVSVVPLGQELILESEMAGITVRSPMVDVRTVAAGGSSICEFDGHALTVGPSSVGSDPGPLCFGLPRATALSLTDVDLLLGRLVQDAFPLPLDVDRARAGARRLLERVQASGHQLDERRLLLGYREIAAAHMAEAIRQVTIDRGLDPRDSPLLVFGGAAGQHACAVGRALGVSKIIVHQKSSVLSAFGIGLAEETALETADAGRKDLDALQGAEIQDAFLRLEERAAARLGAPRDQLASERIVLLGYPGTTTRLPTALSAAREMQAAFERLHQKQFGFLRPGSPIEAQSLRVVLRRVLRPEHPGESKLESRAPSQDPNSPVRHQTSVVLDDGSDAEVPLIRLPLPSDRVVRGPALLIDETNTIWVEPGYLARQQGALLSLDATSAPPGVVPEPGAVVPCDPVRLEVMAARFMSIAEQMGRALQRSAQSTNIRERLDFSCALFDRRGQLVANAPHIPVHLGAMGETVRAAMRAFPQLGPGEVVVTNDPDAGGSHLPDITVVSPVFSVGDVDTPSYFVACRGHHADIGGIAPGSMPPHASTLDEEGVLLRPMLLASEGRFLEEELRAVLSAGPWPARAIEQNLGDLRAQVAANRLGAELLLDLEREVGGGVVQAYMQHLLSVSAAKVRDALARLPAGSYQRSVELDDGTPLSVNLEVVHPEPGSGSLPRLVVDFAGSSSEVPTNLNAPRAVTRAAVLYFVRTLTGDRLPLTDGCLWPVTLSVPRASVLDPSFGRAISAGNVETSMQICDLLLYALGTCAAGQGTMNNLTFGDDTFGYYETIAGGAGAGPSWDGASGVHTHMTNTRITDPEILESRFPIRLLRFELRAGSGGAGRHRGGDGLVRELEALRPLQGSLVSERRRRGAPGASGGQAGVPGRNWLNGRDLGGRASFHWPPGSVLRVETPGGGGYGAVGPAESGPAESGPAESGPAESGPAESGPATASVKS